MRKEGLTLSGSMRVPDLSFPETVINAGSYCLNVPALSVKAGSHIAKGGFRSLHSAGIHQRRGREAAFVLPFA